MFAERGGIALVQGTKIAEPLVGSSIAADADTALAEELIELLVAFARQTIGKVLLRLEREDLGEIDHGVASHGEGELRLPGFVPANAGDEKGGCVEDGGEGADPALVGVLRAEI